MKPSIGMPINRKRSSAEIETQLNEAIVLHQRGAIHAAQVLYQRILDVEPKHFDSQHLLGVAFCQTGQLHEGVRHLYLALKLNPDHSEIHCNLGNALRELKQFDQALTCYDTAIRLSPSNANAHFNRGNLLRQLKRRSEALASYNSAIALRPNYAQFYTNRGKVQKELGRLEQAGEDFDTALRLDPNSVDAHNSRGLLLKASGFLDEALQSYNRAISLQPTLAELHNNHGAALAALERFDEAIESFERALKLNPRFADALCNMGDVLRKTRRLSKALESYSKAAELKPDSVEARNGLGVALMELNRSHDALTNFDCAIALDPLNADGHNNRGIALRDLKRLGDALESIDNAISLNPACAEAYVNRGNVLLDLRREAEALDSYDKALTIRSDYAEAHCNRGRALVLLKRLDEALQSYQMAFLQKPDIDYLAGNLLHTKMALCDWHEFDETIPSLETDILNGKKSISPWQSFGLFDKPEIHLAAAKTYAKDKSPPIITPVVLRGNSSTATINIGYYSADFHSHATTYLISEFLESHDRTKFQLYGFSFGPRSDDNMRKRIQRVFDTFYEVDSLEDRDVAYLSRNLGIDIAVDLKGFTKDARPGIFAQRCAPVQVNYLGYPGTMGADFIDYIVADRVLIPESHRQFYTEKVVYLPDSYQANDSKRIISNVSFSRRDLGIPDDRFVFCCFNASYKILPETFNTWMRILRRTEKSVLWLFHDNEIASLNLRREAAARGVDPDRIIFADRMPLEKHLARHRCADLFLDTFPCNAHTTASDALWAGLPVLTHAGNSFAARVAASLLNALDMGELVAGNTQEFEELAVSLATEPDKLANVKKKLECSRLRGSLFNGKQFAASIETAYMKMIDRHRMGLPPEHIDV